MRHFTRGLRAGIVLIRTAPVAATAAIIALALGIGFSTTMFSIVHGATRGLPFPEPDEIVAVTKIPVAGDTTSAFTRGLDYHTWEAVARALIGLEAFTTQSLNLGARGEDPIRLSAAFVTPGTFARLGVAPARGRDFTDADARLNAAPTVMLSDALWTRRFSKDPAVVGQVVRLDGNPYVVIGVMPERFGFPIRQDVWLPFAPAAGDTSAVQVWGRLAPDATRAAARNALGNVSVIPFTEVETPREVITGLYVLLIAVSGVLVIACVNVANLFIARAAARARDTAVRLALGASRRVLLWEQAGEAVVLATLACGLGVLIAAAGTAAFRDNTAHIIEAFWVDFRLDPLVLAFAVGLAIAAAVGAALVPAWRSSKADVVHTLRDGGGASRHRIGRTSRVLVTGQVTFACALLALTLLLGRSAIALQSREWPFEAEAVLSTNISIPLDTLNDPEKRLRLLRDLTASVEAIPGVRGAVTSVLPGRGAGSWSFGLDTPVTETSTGTTGVTAVSAGYFDTLGARAIRGRVITHADRDGAPAVAVVNESWVQRFSADRDPIGRQIYLGTRAMTVVGVVPDLMPGDIQDLRQDGVYASILQQRPFAVRVLARHEANTPLSAQTIRDAITRVDPELPLYETMSVRSAALYDKEVLTVLSSLFGVFGAGAIALTAIGLFSVMTLLVALRMREFGIRLALGAAPRDLIRLVVGQASRQVVPGLGLGLALGYGLTRVFASAVEAITVEPWSLLTLVALTLSASAAAALVGPTWTATRLNPVRAMRAD